MFSTSEKRFSILYALIVILHLIFASVPSLNVFTVYSKPTILSSLMVFFYLQSTTLSKPIRNMILLALLFSLTGDVALLFEHKNPMFFIVGLSAFLCAHLLYMTAFLKQRDRKQKPMGFILLLLVYASILFYYLKNDLGELLIPVVVYMLAILGMATTAFMRTQEQSALSYRLVLSGAILFMISDSILAYDKFSEPVPFSAISIMITYALAQYLIAMGILKQPG